MSENTDALRKGYEAYGSGDTDTLQEVWADDIRWEGPNSEELPGGGVHEGRDAVMEMLGRIGEAWESFSVTPDEWFEEGDTVVVLGHSEGRAKEGGTEVKVPFVHVWRMAEGKVKEVQTLTDTKAVADALGV